MASAVLRSSAGFIRASIPLRAQPHPSLCFYALHRNLLTICCAHHRASSLRARCSHCLQYVFDSPAPPGLSLATTSSYRSSHGTLCLSGHRPYHINSLSPSPDFEPPVLFVAEVLSPSTGPETQAIKRLLDRL